MSQGIIIKDLNYSISNNGNSFQVLKNINLELKPGDFKAVLGPSGCGKTSLLNIISGLVKPDSGSININGSISKSSNDVGVIFQDFGLFPWLNVFDNIAFGLKLKKISKIDIKNKVEELLQSVGLSKFGNYYPHQLSGGMKQRVAIARVIATDAEFLLMDEPFSALDILAKNQLKDFLIEIWEKYKKTIVFITHNIEEAISCTQSIYIMSNTPGTIIDEIDINLGYPRNLTDPKLSDIYSTIYDLLLQQSKKQFL